MVNRQLERVSGHTERVSGQVDVVGANTDIIFGHLDCHAPGQTVERLAEREDLQRASRVADRVILDQVKGRLYRANGY